MYSNNNPHQFDTRRSHVRLCPCGKSNKDGKFAPFKGYRDKGHCHSCGETFFPERGRVSKDAGRVRKPSSPALRPTSLTFIPQEVFRATLQPAQNNFIRFLQNVFGKDITLQLIKQYYIATVQVASGELRVADSSAPQETPSHQQPATRNLSWKGATVFWQINLQGKVCAGKVMLYDSATGKRVKDRNATWIHKVVNLNGDEWRETSDACKSLVPRPPSHVPATGYTLHQCLFGEHLLSLPENSNKPIAVAESEKTSIIASVYLPEFVWLASGGKTMLSDAKCKTLAGRNVTLFPDANAFQEWKAIANRHAFNISTFHEQHATEAVKAAGLDIADYLLQHDWEKWDEGSGTRDEGRGTSAQASSTRPSSPDTRPYPRPSSSDTRPFPRPTSSDTRPFDLEDILEVQQYLHEIEARNNGVPQHIWNMFWTLYDNRCDGEAWRGLVGFIGRN